MKNVLKITWSFVLLNLTSCDKNTLTVTGCYKATVIAFDCAYIVKVEGGSIGETWHGTENCVTISNLPSKVRQIGSTLYFASYGPGSGPFCTADRSYDYPRITISIDNYSLTNCPNS